MNAHDRACQGVDTPVPRRAAHLPRLRSRFRLVRPLSSLLPGPGLHRRRNRAPPRARYRRRRSAPCAALQTVRREGLSPLPVLPRRHARTEHGSVPHAPERADSAEREETPRGSGARALLRSGAHDDVEVGVQCEVPMASAHLRSKRTVSSDRKTRSTSLTLR